MMNAVVTLEAADRVDPGRMSGTPTGAFRIVEIGP